MTCEHEDCQASLGRDPGYVYYSPEKKKKVRCCDTCWQRKSRVETKDFVYGFKDRKSLVRELERK